MCVSLFIQVGTLDVLVSLSDQLQKLDPFVEGSVDTPETYNLVHVKHCSSHVIAKLFASTWSMTTQGLFLTLPSSCSALLCSNMLTLSKLVKRQQPFVIFQWCLVPPIHQTVVGYDLVTGFIRMHFFLHFLAVWSGELLSMWQIFWTKKTKTSFMRTC